MPAVTRGRDGVGDVAGPVPAAEPAQLGVGDATGRRTTAGLTPASTSAAASPRSSGPGLASSVISASGARPKRVPDVRGSAGRGRPSGACDGVPPPRYSVSSGAPLASRTPRRAHRRAGRARRAGPRGTRRSGCAVRARPRRRRPRSRSTDRARRRRGRGRRAPAAARIAMPAAGLGHRSRDADSRPPMTRQPSGGRSALVDLLDLAAAGLGLADVAGRQEDREARDGVAQERRGDPAGHHRQPAADQTRSRASARAGSGRASGAPSRVVSVYTRVWMTIASGGSRPTDEQQPEERAAERDLVDERGRGGVEQRARVRPGVREPDAVVAIPGEAERLGDAGGAVQQPAEDRPEPVARPEVAGRSGATDG